MKVIRSFYKEVKGIANNKIEENAQLQNRMAHVKSKKDIKTEPSDKYYAASMDA